MKALISKELRENFKIGAIGIVVFALLVLQSGISYSRFIDAVALGKRTVGMMGSTDLLHPLSSQPFTMAVGFLCAIFGILLGWLQMHHEKQRDLWAFLIHRPIPCARVFWAKVIAGLALYVLSAGLPLFGFLFWMSIPGHLAAPFEWAMGWPLAASLLSGIVWYFAGMLTRLREARWYASRALGVGVAVIAMGATIIPWPWWGRALAITVGCGTLLALAVWGSFHSHGHYDRQPALGKIGLTISITLGLSALLACAGFLISAIFPEMFASKPHSSYALTQDGTVCRHVYRGGDQGQVVDLQGKPLDKIPPGHNPMNYLAGAVALPVDFSQGKERPGFLLPPYCWDTTPDTIWFYWTKYGRLVGFNLLTRRLVGSLGPDGFSSGIPKRGLRFNSASLRTLRTPTAVYQADLRARTVKALFVTTNEDPVGATSDSVMNGTLYATDVLTRHWVQSITADGETTWKFPFEQPGPDYTDIKVFTLAPAGQFAILVGPSAEADNKNPGKLPTHVTWFASTQDFVKRGSLDVVKRAELPPLSSANLRSSSEETFGAVIFPPTVILALSSLADAAVLSKMATISLITALLIFVPSGAWLCRRYRFPLRAQMAWALFHLLSGLPGFLAFLAVHDWPARERCTNCNKLRAVNREQCEHCNAEFPPPAKDGTEIFEPLSSCPRTSA